jgi:hypothetical protein
MELPVRNWYGIQYHLGSGECPVAKIPLNRPISPNSVTTDTVE